MTTTTTTTTTTTMMATIDIHVPCSGDEVGAVVGSEEDVRMATTQALTGSSFALGDRQDRVLTIEAGDVKITSMSMPEKHVTLSMKRWARFMSICEKVDIEAREVNHQTCPVAYRAHIGDLYYVSVTSGYGCVDIRHFYVPYVFRARTCVLLAVELVFALTSGHIYHTCRLFTNSIQS